MTTSDDLSQTKVKVKILNKTISPILRFYMAEQWTIWSQHSQQVYLCLFCSHSSFKGLQESQS